MLRNIAARIRSDIRLKFTLPVFSLVVALVLSSGFSSVWRQYKSMQENRETRERAMLAELRNSGGALTRTVALACRQAIVGNDYSFLSAVLDEIRRGWQDLAYGMITDPNGIVLVHTDSTMEQVMLRDDLTRQVLQSEDEFVGPVNRDGEEIMEVSMPVYTTHKWGYVRLGFSKKPVYDRIQADNELYHTQIRKTLITGGLTTIGLVILGGLFTIWMNSKIVTPIQQLTESARRIGRGNFDVSISVSSEDEIGVLSSTLGNMAQSLKQSYSNLSLLNQIGEELSADLAREDFLNRALGRLARLINVEHGIILAGNGGSMRRMTRLACNGAKLSVPVDFALPTELLPPPNSYRLLDSVEALPEPFRCEACAGRIRSVLALPLPRENRVTGLIAVWTLDTERPLTEYEAELAMNVARQIAIGLETVEKVRMSGELEAARNIQRVLFPDGELNLDGFEAAGSLQTASETGGDWYTYRVLHDGRVLLLIGDVTGHGMPAAMIVSTVDSCFHTMATSFIDPSPGSALSVLNRVVYQTTKGRVKMTLFASLYSPLTGEMAFANAGHTHPLLVRSRQDRVEPLRARGPRLGHFEDAVFQESRMQLQKGDSLVYYTDGLVECENPAGEPFGKRRLQEAAASIAELPVLEANTLLLDQVNKFRQDKALADDIALLVARIRP